MKIRTTRFGTLDQKGEKIIDMPYGMLGFPGKMGMGGARVWDAFLAGEIAAIRNYCESDALNTYLVYLRFQLIRGNLTDVAYERELELLRSTIEQEDKPHFRQFLDNWAAS